MCSLGIEPTTFCAADAMLYHWATQEHQYLGVLLYTLKVSNLLGVNRLQGCLFKGSDKLPKRFHFCTIKCKIPVFEFLRTPPIYLWLFGQTNRYVPNISHWLNYTWNAFSNETYGLNGIKIKVQTHSTCMSTTIQHVKTKTPTSMLVRRHTLIPIVMPLSFIILTNGTPSSEFW